MIKKWLMRWCLVALIAVAGSFGWNGQAAEAKALWGKVELKKGMIGKIIVVKDTTLYEWKKNKMNAVRTLKKGQEYRIYSSKTVQGALYYSLGGGLYVKNTSNIQYIPLSPEQFKLLIKQSLRGGYELIVGRERVDFFIARQKGDKLSGWYFYTDDEPLPLEGTIDGDVVTLRVYFDDYYDHILDSVSYLEAYDVPQEEIEDIAEQLMNNDDYYMQFQFTIANDPNLFNGEFRFVELLVDERYDVAGTELGDPFAMKVQRFD